MADLLTSNRIDKQSGPVVLPLTLDQYQMLVNAGAFERVSGKVQLINGRILQMNPQGPQHATPIDILTEWSIQAVHQRYTVRIEKPLSIAGSHSCPEPNVAWVDRRDYFDRHPTAQEARLLIEVSDSSADLDRVEKRDLYAAASIDEYWRLDIVSRTLEIYRQPSDGRYLKMSVHGESETISPACVPESKLIIGKLFMPQRPNGTSRSDRPSA